ncbi:2-hydroxymuconate tautomerase [compost metagenome]
MPIIRVEMLEGRPPELKAALIRSLTQAAVETLGVEPGRVRVLLHELPPENWGVAGAPLSSPGSAEDV